jgi:hypothetical protein
LKGSGIMSYEYSFDFNDFLTLENIEEAKDWDGYIDPKGRFFRTKPNYSDYWMGSFNLHKDFAYDYLREIEKIDDVDEAIKEGLKTGKIKDDWLNGAKDYIVHVLGWVSIGHSNITEEVYTCVPQQQYCGLKPNEIQKRIALKIYEMNNYDMKDYFYRFDGIVPELDEEEIQRINRQYGVIGGLEDDE